WIAYWSYAVTKTTWQRPPTWRATSTPVISGIWMSRNMKSGTRSSRASRAEAPSPTEAITSSSGQSFASLPCSCARRMSSSSATMAVGMPAILRRGGRRPGRRRRRRRPGLALLVADEPPDREPQQDEGREHGHHRDDDHDGDEDREAHEEEPEPVHHGEDDGEREDHDREAGRDARRADERARGAAHRLVAELHGQEPHGHAHGAQPREDRRDHHEHHEGEGQALAPHALGAAHGGERARGRALRGRRWRGRLRAEAGGRRRRGAPAVARHLDRREHALRLVGF